MGVFTLLILKNTLLRSPRFYLLPNRPQYLVVLTQSSLLLYLIALGATFVTRLVVIYSSLYSDERVSGEVYFIPSYNRVSLQIIYIDYGHHDVLGCDFDWL